MTALAPRFTSEEWALMLHEPIRDERYLDTPLGPEIEAFCGVTFFLLGLLVGFVVALVVSAETRRG